MSGIFNLLQPGTIWLITGERGIGIGSQGVGGKSHLSMWLADAFLEQGDGDGTTFVYCNDVISQKQADGTWKVGYPPRYVFIDSLMEFLLKLSENMVAKPGARHLLILDEAAIFVGALSFQSALAQNLQALATIVRKFDLTSIFCLVRASMLIKRLREQEEGLLDGRFYKDSWAIRKWALHLLVAGYTPKEIVVVQLWDAVPDAFTIDMSERLARPKHPKGTVCECCPPGTYAYNTKQPAMFEMGRNPYRGNKELTLKEFQQMVKYLSREQEEDAPQAMYDYLHGKTHVGKDAPDVKIEDVEDASSEKGGQSNKKEVQPEIDQRLRAGEGVMDIFRDLKERGLMKDPSFVYRRKKALEEETVTT